MNRKNLFLFAIISGLNAVITQLVFIREFLNIFSGNELVLGIILFSWLLLTGSGALVGKWFLQGKKSQETPSWLILVSSVLPMVMLVFSFFARTKIALVGEMPGFWTIIAFVSAMLAPFCLLSGFIFTKLLSSELNDGSVKIVSIVYIGEAIGFTCGGLAFYFILAGNFFPFMLLEFLVGLNLVLLFFINLNAGKKWVPPLFLLLLAFLIVFVKNTGLDYLCNSWLYPGQELQTIKESRNGRIAVTRNGSQINYYEGTHLLFSTANEIETEEQVHYPMLQRKIINKVLTVSGNPGAIEQEINKYPIAEADFLALNPVLFDLIPLPEKRTMNLIISDPLIYLRKNHKRYDIVMVNTPQPANVRINRFYTLEFFRFCKQNMQAGAVLSISLPASANYLNDEEINAHAILYQTLKKVFRNVLIVPGFRNYYLASDSLLNLDIPGLCKDKTVDNHYVNKFYLDYRILKEKNHVIMSSISEVKSKINKLLTPAAYNIQITFWLSHFRINAVYLFFPMLLLLLMLIILQSPTNTGLFVTGFTASAVQFILLLCFEGFYGYVYQFSGLILSLFMAGLALGAYLSTEMSAFRFASFNLIQILLGLYLLLILICIYWFSSGESFPYWLVQLFFILFAMDVGAITGTQFMLAAESNREGSLVVSTMYFADLLGSSFGAILITVFILPLTGVVNSLLLLAFLNFFSALLFIFKKRVSLR